MLDIGSGTPLVLLPGIQGRWEWIAPTAQALARTFRVLSFSLPGERNSGCPHDPSLGFELFLGQVDRALDAANVESAIICGVSFGGLIGTAYTASRPGRVRALVLASAPGPRWTPDTTAQGYLRKPLRSVPAFVARAAGRLYPEVVAAQPQWRPRMSFLAGHLARILAAPMSPRRMADRIRLASQVDFVSACQRITAPMLVISGEPELDRVVPVDGMKDYIELVAGARRLTMPRTGHIGMVTQARVFADIVSGFCRQQEVMA
jgi:pimeloyl-ACP methyl ester carboxylesterase